MSRRVVIAVVATAALLLGLPAAGQAASVTVVDTEGKSYPMDFDALLNDPDIGPDVPSTSYGIRDTNGDLTTQTVEGFSLTRLIRASGATGTSYQTLVVKSPGEEVSFESDEVRVPGTFIDGPPVVYEAENGKIGFIRPSRGATDANATDAFETDDLEIVLAGTSKITVDLILDGREFEVGDTLKLRADVEAPAGQVPRITWYFGDRSQASGESVTHTYKKPCRCRIGVTAITSTDSSASDGVYVQIGEPKEGGPDREGGGEDDRDNAPDNGTSTGTGGSEGGTTTGPGTAPVAPVVPPAVTPPPVEPPDPEKPPREPTPTGEEVSGELLQDAVVVTPEPEKRPEEKTKAATARTGTPEGAGFGIPGAALGGMSVLALLGFGGLAQAGKIRPDSMMWHMNRLVGR